MNHTVISGEIGQSNTVNDNLKNLLYIQTGNFASNTVLLDGIGFFSANNNTGINGAVYNERYQTRFQNCYFGNNISNGEGAAIYSVGYNPTIDQCEFWDNQAMQGGAVYIGYNLSNYSHANIFNSRFVRNSAALGGAVKIDHLQCYIVNTEFIDNTSPFNGEGSALSEVNNGNYSVVNSNFIHNNGNSLFHVGSVGINNYFVNCMFFKNSKIRNANNNAVLVAYCLSEEAFTNYTESGNNIIADPQFKYYNELDPPTDGNYELKNCSPAINAGNNPNIDGFLSVGEIDSDKGGKPRKRDNIVDIGAFEYYKDTLVFENGVLLGYLTLDFNSPVSILNCTSDQVVSSSLATTIPHSYIPTTSASYAMIFTHPGGCLDTTDCLNVTVNPWPNDPTNLQATAITSPLSVSLTWNDNSFNEDGFEIERGTDGVNFASIGDVVANVTTYTDNTVAPNTTYYYRVIAWNTSYLSDYSNVAQATTSTLSLVEAGADAVRLYPNPTTGQITLQGVEAGTAYAVCDLSGKALFTGTLISGQSTIDLSALQNGYYLIQLANYGIHHILVQH